MERISSRQNPLVERFRALAQGSVAHGEPDGVDVLDVLDVLLDGEHLLREAIASAVPIEVAVFGGAVLEASLAPLAAEVTKRGARVISVTAPVLEAMSPVRAPSGIAAIARLPRVSIERALERPPQLVFLLHDVQDPGNVGAIVRAGEACGATGIVTGEGTADPFGWRALRGSMGSTFRIPVASRVPLLDATRSARARGTRIFATVPRNGDLLHEADLRQPSAILLGGEGSGLPQALLDEADARLTIPMRAPVESLNVSTAAAIIAYEASRQRAGADRGPLR
jgi:TrmH family RNA methyltransferase